MPGRPASNVCQNRVVAARFGGRGTRGGRGGSIVEAYHLEVRGPDGESQRVDLAGRRVSLGRSRDNEICFSEDASLSRTHLMFESEDGHWFVQDQRSKNGTRVNGEAVSGRRRLWEGDRVQAGRVVAVFHGGEPAPDRSVEFYADAPAPHGATVMTSLDGLLAEDTTSFEHRGRSAETFRPAAVQALIRAGRELMEHGPLDELFPTILDLSVEAVGAERGVILTLEGDDLCVRASKGEGFRISSAVRDRVLREKASVLVQDVSKDEAFQHAQSLVLQNVQTMMAVPLQTDRAVLGLVYVDSRSFVRSFGAEDLNLLTVLANVAAIRIEHQRLLEIEQNERLMSRDLEQAATIQRQLLPSDAPSLVGLEVAGSMTACHTVGGDYYDWFEYGDDAVGIVLADVSGKGLPAALVMTSLQASVRLLAEEGGDPARVLSRLDHRLGESVPDNRFVSLFFCVVRPGADELTYCNAGHNPPILSRADGSVELLGAGGTVLGLLPGMGYEHKTVPFRAGDTLTLFSDGVTEATDAGDEEFGQDRLGDLVRHHGADPAATIIERVRESIGEWTGDAPPSDDVTIVVLKRD